MDSTRIMDTNSVNLPSRQIRESQERPFTKKTGDNASRKASLEDSVSDSLRSARELIDKIKKDIPENRPEMIELGKRLLQDETYPSVENLRTVATKLLEDLGEPDA